MVPPKGKLYLFAVSVMGNSHMPPVVTLFLKSILRLIRECLSQHISSWFTLIRNSYGSEVLPSSVYLAHLFPAWIQSVPFLLHPSFSDTSPRHLLLHAILLCVCPASRSIRWPLQCYSVRGQFGWCVAWKKVHVYSTNATENKIQHKC